MKIQFHDYEINITAKMKGNAKAYKEDTQYLLNFISCAMHSGANWQDAQGCHFLADDMRNSGRKIFETLDKQGFYKDINKKG